MCGFCLAGHPLALPCPIILWRGTWGSSCLRSVSLLGIRSLRMECLGHTNGWATQAGRGDLWGSEAASSPPQATVPTIKLPLSSVCEEITTLEVLLPSFRLRQGHTRHREGSHAPPACLAHLSLQQRVSFQPHEIKSRDDRAGNTMTTFRIYLSSEAKASLIQATAAKTIPQGYVPRGFGALLTGNPCSTSSHWAYWGPFSLPYLTGTNTEY